MPTPAKPNQPYPFRRAPATLSHSFVPQIKPDASPEGKTARNFGFFLAAWALPSPRTTAPQLGNPSNNFTLAPPLTREVNAAQIANYWVQPGSALPKEETQGMGRSSWGLDLGNTAPGSAPPPLGFDLQKRNKKKPQGAAPATCLDTGLLSHPLPFWHHPPPKIPQFNLTPHSALTYLLIHGIIRGMQLATDLNLVGLGAAASPSPFSTSPLLIYYFF